MRHPRCDRNSWPPAGNFVVWVASPATNSVLTNSVETCARQPNSHHPGFLPINNRRKPCINYWLNSSNDSIFTLPRVMAFKKQACRRTLRRRRGYCKTGACPLRPRTTSSTRIMSPTRKKLRTQLNSQQLHLQHSITSCSRAMIFLARSLQTPRLSLPPTLLDLTITWLTI